MPHHMLRDSSKMAVFTLVNGMCSLCGACLLNLDQKNQIFYMTKGGFPSPVGLWSVVKAVDWAYTKVTGADVISHMRQLLPHSYQKNLLNMRFVPEPHSGTVVMLFLACAAGIALAVWKLAVLGPFNRFDLDRVETEKCFSPCISES